MATGMKLWLTATLTGVAIVAAWRLPPEPFSVREAAVKPAETQNLEKVNEEFRVTAEALRRVLWADSLAPLALESADDGVALLYPAGADVNENQVDRFTEMIRTEVEAHRGSDMVFGYVLQPYDQNREPEMGPSARDRAEMFVGQVDGRAYCLQVRVHHPSRTGWTMARKLSGTDRSTRPESGTVGACRPYLRHGMPGSGIQQWMKDGGAGFATEHGESDFDIPRLMRYAGRRNLLGFSNLGARSRSLESDRCLAGHADACVALFLKPELGNPILARDLAIVSMSPVTAIGARSMLNALFVDEEYLLHDLEVEFGSEAFQRFWTADADVERAFAEAFGVELGDWLVSWVDDAIGVDPPGPGLSRSASTGSTLTLALLLGFAFMRNRKRQLA